MAQEERVSTGLTLSRCGNGVFFRLQVADAVFAGPLQASAQEFHAHPAAQGQELADEVVTGNALAREGKIQIRSDCGGQGAQVFFFHLGGMAAILGMMDWRGQVRGVNLALRRPSLWFQS